MINYSISSKLFNNVYLKYLNSQQDVQIFFGGSSSGKSFFLAQRCIIDVMTNNRNYLVCRKVQRTLKKSVYNELTKTIELFKMQDHFMINKSDGTFTCSNGNQILLAGLDDTEKIKSITPSKGVITDIWIEEATETERKDLLQLQKRLRGQSTQKKRIILSFNPIFMSHWLYKEFFDKFIEPIQEEEKLLILKTTYKNNRFLTEQDVYNLENETDEYFKNVYTLGNWGVLGETIFKNFRTEKIDVNRFDKFFYGLDFGFSSDPCGFVEIAYDKNNKTIYILDEFEEHQLTNDMIANKLKDKIREDYIYCDSAEPKSIRELQLLGIRALPVKKGKGSINFGIDWLRRHTIIINENCINTKREFELYRYKQVNGMAINVPVDKDNHLIDAIRYALEDEMIEEQAILF